MGAAGQLVTMKFPATLTGPNSNGAVPSLVTVKDMVIGLVTIVAPKLTVALLDNDWSPDKTAISGEPVLILQASCSAYAPVWSGWKEVATMM